jgi:hypothetical protein
MVYLIPSHPSALMVDRLTKCHGHRSIQSNKSRTNPIDAHAIGSHVILM